MSVHSTLRQDLHILTSRVPGVLNPSYWIESASSHYVIVIILSLPSCGVPFFEQGRTILPPLTIDFPASDSPSSLFNVTSTRLTSSLDSVRKLFKPIPYLAAFYSSIIRATILCVLTVVEPSLTVLTLNAKTHLLSSKHKPDTLRLVIIRTSCYGSNRDSYSPVVTMV